MLYDCVIFTGHCNLKLTICDKDLEGCRVIPGNLVSASVDFQTFIKQSLTNAIETFFSSIVSLTS